MQIPLVVLHIKFSSVTSWENSTSSKFVRISRHIFFGDHSIYSRDPHVGFSDHVTRRNQMLITILGLNRLRGLVRVFPCCNCLWKNERLQKIESDHMGKLEIHIFFNFVVGIYFKASSEVIAVTMATGQLQEKDLYISGFQIISKLSRWPTVFIVLLERHTECCMHRKIKVVHPAKFFEIKTNIYCQFYFRFAWFYTAFPLPAEVPMILIPTSPFNAWLRLIFWPVYFSNNIAFAANH